MLQKVDKVQNIENQKRKLLRYMDRSKRTTNPNNFNNNGTIKKGIKLEWSYSKKYIKAKNELKDLYRKQADIREQDHNIMSNDILRNCCIFYVENMNFKGLQKRAKKTEKNNLVEGINNLIEEKTKKVEKSKKDLKAEAKK